jgi:hypothetical protein
MGAPREPLMGSGCAFWNGSKNEPLGSSLASPAVKLLAAALEVWVELPPVLPAELPEEAAEDAIDEAEAVLDDAAEDTPDDVADAESVVAVFALTDELPLAGTANAPEAKRREVRMAPRLSMSMKLQRGPETG